MIWTTYLMAAALAHVLCAALLMQRRARAVSGWRMELRQALLGQLVITIAGIVVTALIVLVAEEAGLTGTRGLTLLGLFVMVVAWSIGLALLVTWLAQRSKGSFFSPVTMKRVTKATFVSVLAWYGAGGALVTAAWWFNKPAVTGAGAPVTAKAQPAAAPVPRVQSAASPAPAALPQPKISDEDAVMAAVNTWAAAWGRRDADAYLAAYAREFRVPDGLSRPAWEAQRRQRISAAAYIRVGIDGANVSFPEPGKATVKFRQDYRSNLLSNIGGKTLRMARRDNAWQIVEERSGD